MSRHRRIALGSAAAGVAVVMTNWVAEVFRFASPVVNAVVLLSAAALMVAGTLWPLSGSRRVSTLVWWSLPITVSVGLVIAVAVHLASILGNGGVDSSFERVATAPVEGGEVAVYRTDCGATCNHGIVVRHERALLPGILLVRRLGSFYPAFDATCDIVDEHAVRVTVTPPPGEPERLDPDPVAVFVTVPRVYF